MKTAKVNTIINVLSFNGHPLTRGSLKGKIWCEHFEKWLFVIKPLETNNGYYKGELDTCHAVIPSVCKRWLNKGLTFAPKPYNIDLDNLPIINDF